MGPTPTPTPRSAGQQDTQQDELLSASISGVVAAQTAAGVSVKSLAPSEEADPREAGSRHQNPDSHAQISNDMMSIQQTSAEAVDYSERYSGGNDSYVVRAAECTVVSGGSSLPEGVASHIAAELAA